MFKVTVRVVETMGDAKHDFGFKDFNEAIEWVSEQMVRITGGATIDPIGVGMWRNDDGVIVKEKGCNIWTLTDSDDAVKDVRNIARQAALLGEQDCVLFTVEEVKAEFVKF